MRTKLLYCLLGCVCSVCPVWAYDMESDGIYYSLHDNGTNRIVQVVAGDKPYCGELYVPDTVVHEGVAYPVTEFAWNAFEACSELTLIRIPENVLRLSGGMFKECTSLKTVLYDARDAYWNQPNPGWKSIETLILGEKTAVITSGMFYGCEKLSSVTLSDALRYVAPRAFEGTAVYQDERNWKDGVLYIDRCLVDVREPETFAGRYEVLPDTRLIADRAFEGCVGLTEVSLPVGLKAIGGKAFYGCSGLESINIPEELEMIRESAFTGCDKLTRLRYEAVDCRTRFLNSSSMYKDSIGWGALTELTFGEKVESIPIDMFENCRRLRSLVLPDHVRRIGAGAFYGCERLASIDISADIEEVGPEAFGNTAFSNDMSNWENGMLYLNTCLLKADRNLQGRCEVRPGTHLISSSFQYCHGMTEVVLPESVRYIGQYAFSWCNNLRSANLPEGLVGLDAMCFYYCPALDSISIPQSVKWINGFAFMGAGLKYVEILGSVETIWRNAFSLCEDLSEMWVYADIPPNAHESAFELMGDGNVPVYVQTSVYDAYASHEVWGKLNLMRMADVKVPDPFADAEGVFVQGNEIIIGGTDAPLASVYDVSGRCVYRDYGNRIPMPHAGVYLVQMGENTVKVVVR